MAVAVYAGISSLSRSKLDVSDPHRSHPPTAAGRSFLANIRRTQVDGADPRAAEADTDSGRAVPGEGRDDVGSAVDGHVQQQVTATAGAGQLDAGRAGVEGVAVGGVDAG